jgi:hypothetical protein
MKDIRFLSACIAIVTITTVSCKKSSVEPAAPGESELKLLTRDWVISAGTISPSLGGITDFFNQWWDPCDKDNIYKFGDGGIYILDEGPLKCSPGNPQTKTGVWTYNSNSKDLYFKAGYDYYTMNVVELSNSGFKAITKDTISGVVYTETWTFKVK